MVHYFDYEVVNVVSGLLGNGTHPDNYDIFEYFEG